MITERLMKPGNWSCRLREDTPEEVLAAINVDFDCILVLPAEVGSPSLMSDADLKDASIYSGVLRSRPTRRDLVGQGLPWFLGSDDGVGEVITSAVTQTAATLSTWISALIPTTLDVGTVTNAGTGTLSFVYNYLSPREAIDHMCRQVGAEWRVNHDGSLDAAVAATLFPTTVTPTVMITRRPSSTLGDPFKSIAATKLEGPTDVVGYTDGVIVFGRNGDGATIVAAAASNGAAHVGINSGELQTWRLVNAPLDSSTTAANLVSELLSLYSGIRQGVVLSSDSYALPLSVKPGDAVYVYDRERGIVGSTQVTWEGQQITPAKVRVRSITHPFKDGYSVVMRHERPSWMGGSLVTYTDLTPHMVWETQETTWEVGTSTFDPENDSSQLGGAYLGVHPEIMARLSGPPWNVDTGVAFTNVTGGAGNFEYQFMNNSTVAVRGYFTAGTATAAGKIKVSVPFTPATIYPGVVTACEGTGKGITAITDDPVATISFAADYNNANWGAGASLSGVRYTGIIHIA